MAYQQTEGRGSLFVNDYKTSDRQPDYKGTILIEGKLYDIAMWNAVSQSGKSYFSLKAEVHVEGKYSPREQISDTPQTRNNAAVAKPQVQEIDYDYSANEDPDNPDLPF